MLLYDVCFSDLLLCDTLVHADLLQMAQVHSVLWFSGIPLYTCARSSLFRGCFHLLAVVNSAEKNT